MMTLLFPFPRCCRILCLSLLAVLPCSVPAEILPEDGPTGFESHPDPGNREWQELDSELPPWPELNRLIELDIDTGARGYHLYLDPQSLTVGKDRVVRFTSVMISPTGTWNVSYEGLHCGKENHRRFAYGMHGSWHELRSSPWSKLSTAGTDRYRWVLYYKYMCNPTEQRRDADDILRSLRLPPRLIGD